jgi:hypothetical protein
MAGVKPAFFTLKHNPTHFLTGRWVGSFLSMNKLLFSAVFALLILVACKPTKKIQTAIAPKDTSVVVKMSDPTIDSAAVKRSILTKVNSNKINFTTFNAKVKLDFTDVKGKNTDATAFIRIQKDSIIWLSLTGALGIEGFRIYVRPDSVTIMNKLDKEISYRSVTYLQDLIKLPVDFYTLQDLIIGNPVFFPDNIVSYRTNGSNLQALGIGQFFKHLVTLDTADNRILHSKLDDVEATRNRTCDITLGDYENTQGHLFSKNREITVTEKAKLEIKLDFKQYEFDKPQSFPFNIPKNYKTK